MGIGVSVEEAINTMLDDFVTSRSAALCADLVPIAIAGATIHFMLVGFAIIRGDGNDSMQTFIWKTFRSTFIASIALSAGTYQVHIVGAVSGLEGMLIQSMSGMNTVGELIDQMAQPFLDLGNQIWNKAVVGFWPNFGLVAAAGFVAIAELLIIGIGLGFYILAKIGLTLTLAIGPVFLLCAMWPATEKYAESWLGQVLNYVLLKVLIALSLGMLLTFASQFAKHIEANQDAMNVIRATTSLLICSAALAVVLLNLPQLASALAGGASISGIGRTIGRTFLDTLNKIGRSGPPSPGGAISPKGSSPVRRDKGTGPAPPPRAPLFQRNTIERIRKNH